MKKIMLFVILSIIIIAVYGSFLLLSQSGALTTENRDTPLNSTSPSANRTYNVKITKFNFTGHWQPGPVFPLMGTGINITLQNLEKEDLNGLSIQVKMYDSKNNELPIVVMLYGRNGTQIETFDGTLHAGEVRTIKGAISSDWHTVIDTPKPSTTVASIKLGNETLDEWAFKPNVLSQ